MAGRQDEARESLETWWEGAWHEGAGGPQLGQLPWPACLCCACAAVPPKCCDPGSRAHLEWLWVSPQVVTLALAARMLAPLRRRR
jgi:hypothetical protein